MKSADVAGVMAVGVCFCCRRFEVVVVWPEPSQEQSGTSMGHGVIRSMLTKIGSLLGLSTGLTETQLPRMSVIL